MSVGWHRTRHKREGGCWALWEITFFDPHSLSFVRSVSLSEFVSLKWSVYCVYNVKLMKPWIVSLRSFGVFSSTLRMTSLSVIPLSVCVCVCSQHGCGPLQLNNASLRDQEISTLHQHRQLNNTSLTFDFCTVSGLKEEGIVRLHTGHIWRVLNLKNVLIHIDNAH